MKMHLVVFAVAAALTAGLPTASYADRMDIRLGGVSIDIGSPPPVVRYEVVPPPREGFVWMPGCWVWDGHGYAWIAGTWVRERPGYVPVPAYWEPRGTHWHYEPPRWTERHDEGHHEGWYGHRGEPREGRYGDRR